MQRRVADDVGEHDRGETAFGRHELEEPDAAERITAPPAMASCVRPRSAAEAQVEVPAGAATGGTQHGTRRHQVRTSIGTLGPCDGRSGHDVF